MTLEHMPAELLRAARVPAAHLTNLRWFLTTNLLVTPLPFNCINSPSFEQFLPILFVVLLSFFRRFHSPSHFFSHLAASFPLFATPGHRYQDCQEATRRASRLRIAPRHSLSISARYYSRQASRDLSETICHHHVLFGPLPRHCGRPTVTGADVDVDVTQLDDGIVT